MNMLKQMTDQLVGPNVQLNAGRFSSAPAKKEDGSDFGSMVRQKQQQVKQDQSKKADTGSAQAKSEKSDTPEAQQQAVNRPQQEVTDAQYSNAATMMVQFQPFPQEGLMTETPEETEPMNKLYPMLNIGKMKELSGAEDQSSGQKDLLLVPVPTNMPTEHVSTYQQQVSSLQNMNPEEMGKFLKKSTDLEEDIVGASSRIVASSTQESPLFAELNGVPVKVSENFAPIELENNNSMEQLGARLESFITEDNGNQIVELTLTPASLGKLRVAITHTPEGALHVQLNAASDRALNLLQKGAGNLQNLLVNSSRPNVAVEVRGSQQSEQQAFNPNQQNGQQQNQQSRQEHQQQSRRSKERSVEFIQQLRLGLVDNEG